MGVIPQNRTLILLSLALACQAAAFAAPKLRLSQTVIGPLPIAVGATSTTSIDAANAGDGSLNLQVSSSVPWITTSLGALRTNCFALTNGSCTPINITIQPGSLAAGTYTGILTVSDPNAVDAPQTVTVTIAVGGTVPQSLDFYLPPTGGTQSIQFNTAGPLRTTITNANWLAVSTSGNGSFLFGMPIRFVATSNGLSENTYTGQVTIAGSPIPAENRPVPATLHVTSQPIAQLSSEQLSIRAAANGPKQVQNIVVNNRGGGTLTVTGANVTTSSGAGWLSAQQVSGTNIVAVTADPTGLSTGGYSGTVTIQGNAAQGNISVPVQLQVVAAGAPVVSFNGVVNNNLFQAGDFLAQGTIAALFGEQLVSGDPAGASTLPLGTDLGGVRVYVNDTPAPIYYASYNQVNFQMPYDAPTGDVTIRIERNGTTSNRVSAEIVRRAPRLLRLGIGDYAIAVNTDGSFPVPATPGINSRPARAGDTLVFYALGLGATSPSVQSGVASPSSPLANATGNPQVSFGTTGPFGGNNVQVTPDFAGLTPGFVGLFQINVRIPANAPKGDAVPVTLFTDDGNSNLVTIAIQ